ncbi:MAG: hypothetical protein HN712_01075 [Gemmatimonadetes bacterium]|jgi:hypothetical protein|nr:hypothetical protein [Gemmatimonadota bacterium]MBT7858863.1 hypothetical protein [Gemmatimonadota bacterium]
MKRRRTLYFNDARHYYLFVHEPPIRLEDAQAPIDEIAGTGVDTFVYGVSRDDGLFYPSKVGKRFGEKPFEMAAYWRVWQNMQSLMDRGLDPLTVLIEGAHERGMDFIASQRMGAFPGAGDNPGPRAGGRGMMDEYVRDHQFGVLRELALDYPTQGIELDFAAAPTGTDWWVPQDELPKQAPMVTEFMRRVRDMSSLRQGESSVIGARVYPTRELNEAAGLEVETWIQEGLVDYVLPVVYAFMILDSQMPIQWLVDAAADTEVSVYAMLQPYYSEENRPLTQRVHASPAMFRAGAANAWQLGVDGLYTWFMPWPLTGRERAILTELAHPEQLRRQDRHYVLRRTSPATGDTDYPAQLPMTLDPAVDLEQAREITFTIADDLSGEPNVADVRLRLAITDLTGSDRFDLSLNGVSLADVPRHRSPMRSVDPYSGQWLELDLRSLPPRLGHNVLQFTLRGRPEGLVRPLVVEDVELLICFDTYAPTPFT